MQPSAPGQSHRPRIACIATLLLAGLLSLPAQTNQPTAAPTDVQHALQMPDGPDRNKALGAAIKAWAQRDPDAYVAWTVAQPQKIYDQARMSAAACGDAANPKTGADWLVQQGTPHAIMVMHGYLLGWSKTAPDAVIAWCSQASYSNPDVRYAAFFTIGDGLCRKDPAMATAWAAQLPQNEDRLAAVHGIALIWARGNISAVTAWIQQLNPQDMKRAAMAVAETWRLVKNGGPSLEAWLDQLPLSPADKQEVLKGPRPDEFNFSKYQPPKGA